MISNAADVAQLSCLDDGSSTSAFSLAFDEAGSRNKALRIRLLPAFLPRVLDAVGSYPPEEGEGGACLRNE